MLEDDVASAANKGDLVALDQMKKLSLGDADVSCGLLEGEHSVGHRAPVG